MRNEGDGAAPEVWAWPSSVWAALGLVTLYVLCGSRWLWGDAGASSSSLRAACLVQAVVAVAALPSALRSGVCGNVRWLPLAGGGVALFGVPAVVERLAGGAVLHSGAALYTITPLFVVVAHAVSGSRTGDRVAMRPALVGMTGGLLLLPLRLPGTVREAVGLLLVLIAVLVTAGASVWLYELLRETSLLAGVVVVCGTSALFLGLAAALLEPSIGGSLWRELPLRGIGFEVMELALLVGLLRTLSPERFASRFLLVPLLTLLEGLVFLHARPDARDGVGLTLMAAGGVWLLFGKEDAARSSMLGLEPRT